MARAWLAILACASAVGGLRLPPPGDDGLLSVSESAALYRSCPVRYEFGDKCDHKAAKRLNGLFQRQGWCEAARHMLMAGMNRGQLASVFLEDCNISVTGAEIQPAIFESVKERFAQLPHVHVLHFGWSSRNATLDIVGKGQTASVMAGGSEAGARAVQVLPLGDFVRAAGLQEVEQFTYMVIDTEGHEPFVVDGMHLESEAEQRRFPAFQFEVGGGWLSAPTLAANYTQHDVAQRLEGHGYELYLIGCEHWWRVPAEFFKQGVGAINTIGRCNTKPERTTGVMYVWGNVLAIHRRFAAPALREFVAESALAHAAAARGKGTT